MASVLKLLVVSCLVIFVCWAIASPNSWASLTVLQLLYDDCSNSLCLDPGSLHGSYTTVGYSNDYDPGSASTSCTGRAAAGPDMVFRVALEDGDQMWFSCYPESGQDMALYLVRDCDDMNSCVAGVDTPGTAYEALTYTHVGPKMLYYLIVDGHESSDAGAFSYYSTHYGLTCMDPIPVEPATWGSVKAMYQ